MDPLAARAVLYQLVAMALVFLVSWLWTGSAPQSAGLAFVLFLVLSA